MGGGTGQGVGVAARAHRESVEWSNRINEQAPRDVLERDRATLGWLVANGKAPIYYGDVVVAKSGIHKGTGGVVVDMKNWLPPREPGLTVYTVREKRLTGDGRFIDVHLEDLELVKQNPSNVLLMHIIRGEQKPAAKKPAKKE